MLFPSFRKTFKNFFFIYKRWIILQMGYKNHASKKKKFFHRGPNLKKPRPTDKVSGKKKVMRLFWLHDSRFIRKEGKSHRNYKRKLLCSLLGGGKQKKKIIVFTRFPCPEYFFLKLIKNRALNKKKTIPCRFKPCIYLGIPKSMRHTATFSIYYIIVFIYFYSFSSPQLVLVFFFPPNLS